MITDKLLQTLSCHDAAMILFFRKSMTPEGLQLITNPYKLDIRKTAKRKSNIIVLDDMICGGNRSFRVADIRNIYVDNNDGNLIYVLGSDFVASLYIYG